MRLWWIRECVTPNPPSDLKVPTWPRLLMGFGLAACTGSLVIVGSSVLAGMVWWMGTQSWPSSQTESNNNFIEGLNPIWRKAALGIGMLLLALLTFSIRAL